MAAVADYSTVASDRHLVYLLRQPYRADKAGCPASADYRPRDLHLLNIRLRQNTRKGRLKMQLQCRCNFSGGLFFIILAGRTHTASFLRNGIIGMVWIGMTPSEFLFGY
jgi:hypothetical protein